MNRPNFFILGAMKCGTTSLVNYLSQHPDVFISTPKEPLFFEAEYEKGLDFYWNNYFADWNSEKAIGEARQRNLYLPWVPQRIHESCPNAKLIVLLRNPVDRAYSHWWQFYVREHESLPFEEAIRADLERIHRGKRLLTEEERAAYERNVEEFEKRNRAGWPVGWKPMYTTYIDSGYYAEQIRRYMQFFPKERFLFLFSDEFDLSPTAVARKTFEFLGVDETISIPCLSRRNVARPYVNYKLLRKAGKCSGLHYVLPQSLRMKVIRWAVDLPSMKKQRPQMNPKTRARLISHYYEHNRDLETILGIDLSHWDK